MLVWLPGGDWTVRCWITVLASLTGTPTTWSFVVKVILLISGLATLAPTLPGLLIKTGAIPCTQTPFHTAFLPTQRVQHTSAELGGHGLESDEGTLPGECRRAGAGVSKWQRSGRGGASFYCCRRGSFRKPLRAGAYGLCQARRVYAGVSHNQHGHPEGLVSKEVEVELETPRGRPLGPSAAMLVDVPAEMISHFCNSTAARTKGMVPSNTIQFLVERTMARPTKASVFAQADTWITSSMDPETAQEYLTGEEELEPAEDPAVANGQQGDVSEHQARVRELELLLHQQGRNAVAPQQATAASPAAIARSKAPPLFNTASPSGMTTAEWSRLQQLAGSPPPRVPAAEQRRSNVLPTVAEQDNLLAQLEKEAEDPGQVEQNLGATEVSGSTSLHRVMLAHLQQNQLLLERLSTPKHQDPVLGALTGGNESGSSSSSGVKGMLAREAFVKGGVKSCCFMSAASTARVGVRRVQAGWFSYEALCGALARLSFTRFKQECKSQSA